MRPFSRWRASFVLLLLWEIACHHRQATVPVPPPPAANQPASSAAPPPATSNSQTPSSGAATTHAQDSSPYQVNKPPQPATASKKTARSPAAPPPASSQPASTATPPPASTAPAPKLGDILTPDEQRQYSAAIDRSLAHAQASLNAIGGRQLNKDQQAQVEQIRNFVQQAQSTRASDPAGAKSLAERAEVLARDLAASVH